MRKPLVLACVVALGIGGAASAATVTNLSSSVTQDFNALASTGTGNSFSTWASGTGQAWEASVSSYTAGNGSSNTGALYSFGTNANDRALGSVASSSTGTLFYGLVITNGGTTAITALDISYFGEQWRNGGNTAAHKLTFGYSLTATSISGTGYTGFAALDFTSPTTGGSAGPLDGNDPANRSFVTGTITGLSLLPGQSMRIRWADVDDAGSDHGLAIDDFRLTARFAPEVSEIPLPAAGVMGPAVLAAGLLRRRR